MGWETSCTFGDRGVFEWGDKTGGVKFFETNDDKMTFIYRKEGCLDFNLIDNDWNSVSGTGNFSHQDDKHILEINGAIVYQEVGYPFPQNGIAELEFWVSNLSTEKRLLTVVLQSQLFEGQGNSGFIFRDLEIPGHQPRKRYTIWGLANANGKDSRKLRVEFRSRETGNDFLIIDGLSLMYRAEPQAGVSTRQKSIEDYNNRNPDLGDTSYACDPNKTPICDVPPWDPFFSHIYSMAQLSPLVGYRVTQGYSDGTFRPEEKITRQEMAAFIARGMGHMGPNVKYDPSIHKSSFSDFADVSDIHKPYVWHLQSLSIAKGENGAFKPDAVLTRGEMAAFVARARKELNPTFCSKPPAELPTDFFPDEVFSNGKTWKDHTFLDEIWCLWDKSIASRNRKFDPDRRITRAEAAKFIDLGLVRERNQICEETRGEWTGDFCTLGGQSVLHPIPKGRVAASASAPTSYRYLFSISKQDLNAHVRMEVIDTSNRVLNSIEQYAYAGPFKLAWTAPDSGDYYLRLTNIMPFAREGVGYRLRIDDISSGDAGDIRWTYSVSSRENDSRTCGPDNWIKLWARPNSANQSTVTLRMRKCDESQFVSGGAYWVESTDGAYKSNEHRLAAGQDSVSIDINPYGEKGISQGKDYRIRLRSDNDQQGTPKQTGTVNITPRLQLRTTVTARMNGAILNNIGIWYSGTNRSPDAYGRLVGYYEDGGGPYRFFVQGLPGYYAITNPYPSAHPDERDPYYIFHIGAGEDIVLEFVEDCYELNAFARPSLGGRIHRSANPTCDAPGYRYGEQVTLTAEPALGYRLVRWRGSATGSASSVTVTMNEYRSVVADFEEVCYSLNTSFDESQGRIDIQTASNCEDGAGFLTGTTVSLLATPKDGYEFVRWQGASGPSRATNLTIDSDKSITAIFHPATPTAPLGDVSCDSDANVTDASWILQYDVGLRQAADSCPLAPDTILLDACDVNGDGACDVRDALWLLQCSVGLSNGFCPAALALAAPPAAPASTPARLYLEQSRGQTTIMADLQDNTLAAATIELHYDPAHYTLTGCTSDPDHRFNLGLCNPTYGEGVARFNVVAGNGVTGVAPLAQVTFEPADPATSLQVRVVTFAGVDGAPIVTAGDDSEINIRLHLPFVQR
jgi:hypothetical protein